MDTDRNSVSRAHGNCNLLSPQNPISLQIFSDVEANLTASGVHMKDRDAVLKTIDAIAQDGPENLLVSVQQAIISHSLDIPLPCSSCQILI